MVRKIIILSFLLMLCTPAIDAGRRQVHIMMETSMGTVEFKLYNETPRHKKNFIKLVNEHFFDGTLFHRVIDQFVVQGGDPTSRTARPGEELGEADAGYTIPAEFRLDKGIYHRRGTLNAAREGDDVNPKQESSGSQFCFIWGQDLDDEKLDRIQERLDRQTNGKVKLTPQMRQVYKTCGGSPHLDGQYTVFGEVVKGMDVIDKIQKVPTDSMDRPIEDVRIIRAWVK